MSVLLVIAFAGLWVQDVAPLPSTREPYQAPVIRPFEPGRDFAPGRAQGDAEADLHRRPLEAPVTVEAYVRSYEYTPGDVEIAYEQGVAAAEIRADQAAGPLDGAWRIVDGAGRTVYDLVLSDPGVGAIEGGWRGNGKGGAATSDGHTLTLEGAAVLTLETAGRGWRGVLTADGAAQPVSLVRPH